MFLIFNTNTSQSTRYYVHSPPPPSFSAGLEWVLDIGFVLPHNAPGGARGSYSALI